MEWATRQSGGPARVLRLTAVGVEHLGEGGAAPATGGLDQFSLFRHAQPLAESHMHMITHEELLSLTPAVRLIVGAGRSR